MARLWLARLQPALDWHAKMAADYGTSVDDCHETAPGSGALVHWDDTVYAIPVPADATAPVGDPAPLGEGERNRAIAPVDHHEIVAQPMHLRERQRRHGPSLFRSRVVYAPPGRISPEPVPAGRGARGERAVHRHGHRLPVGGLVVGMVHGLAGSAALALLASTALPSPGMQLAYIVLFGAGSLLGMALLTGALAVALRATARRLTTLHRALNVMVATASVVIGLQLVWITA